jgi:hypothetical protein
MMRAGAQHVLELGLARQPVAAPGLARQPARVGERVGHRHVHHRQGRRGDAADVVAPPVHAFVLGEGAALLVVDGRMAGARGDGLVTRRRDETPEVRHRGLVAGDGEAAAEIHRVARRLVVPVLRIGVVRAHAEAAVRDHHHLRRTAADGEPFAEDLPGLEGTVVPRQVDARAQRLDLHRLRGDAPGMRERAVGLVQAQRVHRGVAGREHRVGARLPQLDDAQPLHARGAAGRGQPRRLQQPGIGGGEILLLRIAPGALQQHAVPALQRRRRRLVVGEGGARRAQVVERAAPGRLGELARGRRALAEGEFPPGGARLRQLAPVVRQVDVFRREGGGDRVDARGLVEPAGAHREAAALEQRLQRGLHAGGRARIPGRHAQHREVQLQRTRPGAAAALDLAACQRRVGLAPRRLDLAGGDRRHAGLPSRRALRVRRGPRGTAGHRRRRATAARPRRRARRAVAGGEAEDQAEGQQQVSRAVHPVQGVPPATAGVSDLG